MIGRAVRQWAWLAAARLLAIVSGLIMVAIAIPFRAPGLSFSDGRKIVNLPRWAWLWGNDYDGLLGDKRGWWAQNTPFGVPAESWLAMYTWAALRNPANNMRMLNAFSAIVQGSAFTWIGDYIVEDKPGLGGWQLVQAENGGRRWYGFYLVHQWTNSRAFVVRLGFKIKPAHAGTAEPPKGLTFKLNPYKAI